MAENECPNFAGLFTKSRETTREIWRSEGLRRWDKSVADAQTVSLCLETIEELKKWKFQIWSSTNDICRLIPGEFLVAFDVRRTQHIILGFLWYSLGVPVVLKGDLFSKRVSSYVCIFCAILNNLARVIYVISNCHMAITCITGSIKVNKMITRFEFGKRINFGVVF